MKARPTSPHLQIYRPQLTSALSILHRITGVVLALGIPVLILWLLALAFGESSYNTASAIFDLLLVKLVLFGWTFCLFYHLANGIRHLFWDIGLGLDLKTTYLSGKAVVAAAVLLTVLAWAIT